MSDESHYREIGFWKLGFWGQITSLMLVILVIVYKHDMMEFDMVPMKDAMATAIVATIGIGIALMITLRPRTNPAGLADHSDI